MEKLGLVLVLSAFVCLASVVLYHLARISRDKEYRHMLESKRKKGRTKRGLRSRMRWLWYSPPGTKDMYGNIMDKNYERELRDRELMRF